MPVIRSSKAWIPIKYETETTANDSEFQYLSTFEELDDYEIVRVDGEPKSAVKKRKRQKTQASPVKDTIEKPKAKKRKKISKGKSEKSHISKEPDSDSEIDDPNMESENASESDMSAWLNLLVPEPVIRALKHLQYREPTPIQKLTLPHAIRDRLDILGAAETGSGKTLAFGIPIVAGLLADEQDEEVAGPKALILSPTRELALQIKDHLNAILKHTDLKVACIVGGLSIQKQQRLLKKRPEILIATPGRLWALISEEYDYVKNLHQSVRYFAIDETDRMIEKGHFQELTLILEFLGKDPEAIQKRQTFVFSATLTYVHAPPKRLAATKQTKQMTQKDKIAMLVSLTGLRKKHKVVDVTRHFGTAEALTETRLNCGNLLEKDTYLYHFLTNYPGRTLIFTNSIDCSRRLRSLLTHLRLEPLILNAQMHQKQRLKNLERFSEQERSILLATDVAARGLDIKNIEHVIHYQVPRTPEIYVHRSGRTARANRQGISVILVDSKDVGHYRRICRNLNRDKDLDVFPIDPKSVQLARERMQLVTELESLEHRVKRKQTSDQWFERAAKEAELEDDVDMRSNLDESDANVGSDQKTLQSLQRRLDALLNVPIKKKTPVTKYPSAYQLDTTATDANRSKAAIEAVHEAQETEKQLMKKLGHRKLGRVRKLKKGKNKKGNRKKRR